MKIRAPNGENHILPERSGQVGFFLTGHSLKNDCLKDSWSLQFVKFWQALDCLHWNSLRTRIRDQVM